MASKTERFELRLDEELLARIDEWRSERGDLPSRAEAIRTLVEVGLKPVHHGVNFSDGERTLMLMLKDIRDGLKLKSAEIDFEFISKVIYGGHYWAPRWEMNGVFHDHSDDPAQVKFTVDVLDMWSFLEEGYEKLSKKDKERFTAEAAPHHAIKFRGFDGNNEAEHMSIASFLIEDMGRFSRFKGRSLNAHHPTLDRYRKMYAVFEPLRPELGIVTLTLPQLLKIMAAGDRRSGSAEE